MKKALLVLVAIGLAVSPLAVSASQQEPPVQRVTGFDTIMPYYKLELDYLPDAARIDLAIDEIAAY